MAVETKVWWFCVVGLSLVGCATTSEEECRTAPPPAAVGVPTCVAVPEGPRDVLFAENVERATLYFDAEGNVAKYTAYVKATAIPAWVVQMADEKLGPGDDVEWEVEYYGADHKVYEVTRKLPDGGVKVLSASDDRQLFYVQTELQPSAVLPEPVSKRISEINGFKLTQLSRKEYGDGTVTYQARGLLSGQDHQLTLSDSGELRYHTRSVPAKIEIPVRN